jgi:hypothetical protein
MCRMLNDFRSWRGCVRPGYVHGGENDCSSEAMKKGENDNVCENPSCSFGEVYGR